MHILLDHAYITSMWHNKTPVIIIANDLPHEIQAKCRPVEQPASSLKP